MNLWELDFWENDQKNCPVEKEMQEIQYNDHNSHEFINKKIKKYLECDIRDLFKSKYIKDLKNGLYYLVISVKNKEFRMMGIIEYSQILLPKFLGFHCFFKKSQKIPKKHINTALERLKEYKNQKNIKIKK